MLVKSLSDFQRALDTLRPYRGDGFLVDCETTGLLMYKHNDPSRMCSIQVAPITRPDVAAYFPYRHGEGYNLPLDTLQGLRELLAGVMWMGHNISFDIKMLMQDGFKMPPSIRCSMIAAHTHIEHERQSKHGKPYALKKLCAQYFGEETIQAKVNLKAELKARGLSTANDGMENLWRLPCEVVYQYGVDDLKLSAQLHALKIEELRKWRTEDAYYDLCEYQLALIRMEHRGIQLHKDEVARQMATIEPRILELRTEIDKLSGGINPNSPKQLKEWLKLEKTNKDFLKAVMEGDPRRDLRALLEWREVTKATSTYFNPFLELCDSDSRVHTSFKVNGTITGRLSSNGPNMQNCSRDQSGRAYSLKRCYKAKDGHIFLEADYASVEPRLGAYFTRDPGLVELFQKGLDVYRPTAQRMFNVAQASDEQRTSAKSVVLGIAYGMGAFKMAVKLNLRHQQLADGTYEYHHDMVWGLDKTTGDLREMSCSEVSAQYCACEGRSYMRAYFDAVPEMQPFIKNIVQVAKRNGYIRYPLSGRTKKVDYFFDKEKGRMGDNAHRFYNFLLQGSAADIMRRAIVAIDKAIPEEDAAMLLTVHDSLLCELPIGPRSYDTAKEVLRLMETTTRIDPVPLVADAKVGPTWGNMMKFS